jgi:hypothetical protein
MRLPRLRRQTPRMRLLSTKEPKFTLLSERLNPSFFLKKKAKLKK